MVNVGWTIGIDFAQNYINVVMTKEIYDYVDLLLFRCILDGCCIS